MDGGGFAVGVFEVQIVIPLLDLFDGHLPHILIFFAYFRTGAAYAKATASQVELLVGYTAVFGVLFYAFGERELVVPDFFGGFAFGEENQIGVHSGIGVEHALGQADDSVNIAFFKQFFLDGGFNALAEKRAVGKHDAGAAVGL